MTACLTHAGNEFGASVSGFWLMNSDKGVHEKKDEEEDEEEEDEEEETGQRNALMCKTHKREASK